MSKALAFKNKLAAYGSNVVLHSLPTTKCTCWANGWPDPDHVLCGGTGYLDAGDTVTVKAFIFPGSDSQKEYHEDMGVAKAGTCKCYFSPDIDLYDYEKLVWDGVTYRIVNRDRTAIANEIIYKVCNAERIKS